ncbi:hypothetical protein BKI52_14570 [marine bacterium AO1-C]|nr:hypothetical protein BKI52_14570 [marine bacterium AO1-C]
MLKNYLKITLRNLWRSKAFSALNILGLSIGMTCAFLLYLYVQDELSFDQHHAHKDQVYRLEYTQSKADQEIRSVVSSGPIAKLLKDQFPQVEQTARIKPTSGIYFTKDNQERFYPQKIFYADPSIFEVLSFKPIAGNLTIALTTSNALVLTRSLATQFFRSPKRAIGKTLQSGGSQSYTVTAVIEDTPYSSHFRPSLLISMSTLRKKIPAAFKSFFARNFPTFVKLSKSANPSEVTTLFNQEYTRQLTAARKGKSGNIETINLQSIADIRLSPAIPGDYAIHTDAQVIYIFIIVAILIILIACINYISLSTARAVERAKEVGVRKVAGAYRGQLIGQFLLESLLISFMALGVSLVLVEVVLPGFNQLADKHLVFDVIHNIYLGLSLVGATVLLGVLSGIYPAFVLSAFQPYKVLKGQFSHSLQGNRFRKVLVVIQFSISIVMIVSTMVIFRQMQYIRSKNLGFNQEQLYRLSFFEIEGPKKYQVLREQLQQNTNVLGVTNTSQGMDGSYYSDDLKIELENGSFTEFPIKQFFISPDYFKVMGIPLTAGRNLDQRRASDIKKGIIVNQAFQRKFGWKKPIGKKVGEYTVVGVSGDFHTKSLYESIEPLAFRLMSKEMDYNAMPHFFVRLKAQNAKSTLAHFKSVWTKYSPQTQFSGKFVNQYFASFYKADQRRGQIFWVFSLLAIFIACLGLFGLATFTTRQRRKEMGIRKVLGASITQLLTLLFSGFARLILISSLIAFPLAYYFMREWLQNFAYRTSIHWSLFILAGIATMCITLLTVSIQSVRTARINPVEVLKDE